MRPRPTTRDEQLELLLGVPMTRGNSIQILVNGVEIFPAMLEAIRGAEKSIHFVTFVYWSGTIAREFADAIARKAREGVDCHVLLDALGAYRMDPALVDQMRDAGARVEFFNPIRPRHLLDYHHRTHRKILVVDRKIGFNGGVGIADEWRGDARHSGEWHDLHFRVTGPVVAQVFNAFVENWNETDGVESKIERLSPSDGDYPVISPGANLEHSGSFDDVTIQSFHSSPGEGHYEAFQLYKAAIEFARESICIENAYFVPDEEMKSLLVDACRRGVRVRVILPGDQSDSWLARCRSRANWGELLKAGIELYRYTPTMSHSKFMIVDRDWVTVGSINFDTVSFRVNEESNLNVFGEPFARRMREIFDYDLSRSDRVEREAWESRGLGQRAEELAARLIPIPA